MRDCSDFLADESTKCRMIGCFCQLIHNNIFSIYCTCNNLQILIINLIYYFLNVHIFIWIRVENYVISCLWHSKLNMFRTLFRFKLMLSTVWLTAGEADLLKGTS